MKTVQKILFILFWLVLIADCLFVYFGTSQYRLYSKLLLMPILFIALLYGTRGTRHPRSKLFIIFVLLFSWIGDVVLLTGDTNSTFAAGLFFFLIAHILYIIFFLHLSPFKKDGLPIVILSSIFIIGYLCAFFF